MDIKFTNTIPAQDLEIMADYIRHLNPKLSQKDILKLYDSMVHNYQYRCFGLYVDQNLKGVCGYWEGQKYYCGKFAEIDNFIIDDALQGQGLGRKFLNHVENYAQNQKCNSIVLNCYIENTLALEFYKNQGYTQLGIHHIKRI